MTVSSENPNIELARTLRANTDGERSYVAAVLGMTWSVTAQQAPAADPFKSLYFRELGPTRQGGRFVDFAVVEATPRIFYAASATGGVFKTENNGHTFTQLFTDTGAAATGAALFSANIVFWRGATHYFDAPAEWNPLLHTVDQTRNLLLWHEDVSLLPLAYTWAAGIVVFVLANEPREGLRPESYEEVEGE